MRLTPSFRIALSVTLAAAAVGGAFVNRGAHQPVPVALVTPAAAAPVEAPVAAPQASIALAPRAETGVVRDALSAAGSDADLSAVPATAEAAYRRAAAVMTQVDTGCGLTWTLLAAIGEIESDHGRHGGATLGADGVSTPVIRGVALDGRGRVSKVRDTDAGAIDGDRRWDRAVGPMQFLPSTWRTVGVDADGDGVRSADDIDDAAMGAAVYLCADKADLTTRPGMRSAVYRYNHSRSYVDDVLRIEASYAADDSVVPALHVSAVSVRIPAHPQVGAHDSASPTKTPHAAHHPAGHAAGHHAGHPAPTATTRSTRPPTRPGADAGPRSDDRTRSDDRAGPDDRADPTTEPTRPPSPTRPGR